MTFATSPELSTTSQKVTHPASAPFCELPPLAEADPPNGADRTPARPAAADPDEERREKSEVRTTKALQLFLLLPL